MLFVLGWIGLQKPAMPLIADGKVVAVVQQPVFRPLFRTDVMNVYAGDEKLFSVSQNYLLDGGPVFIYPFSDGKRFLCDYDDDVAMLDFVVDFSGSTNERRVSGWPHDGYVMMNMEARMTNVVFDTRGTVRLPTDAELQEVSRYVVGKGLSSTQAGYFGLSGPWTKELLLLDLATNRTLGWPVKNSVRL